MTDSLTIPAGKAIDTARDSWDNGDRWGSAVALAFGLADVCEAVGVTAARDTLDYRPSPYVPTMTLAELADDETGEYLEAREIAAAYLAGEITDADLEADARTLSDYLDACKSAGLDY